jgi:hypothetical protein
VIVAANADRARAVSARAVTASVEIAAVIAVARAVEIERKNFGF